MPKAKKKVKGKTKSKKKVKKTVKRNVRKPREVMLDTRGGKVKVTIPADVSKEMQTVILDTLKASLSEEYEKEAMAELDKLTGSINVLMDHLKDDNRYSKNFEGIMRKMVGTYLNRGVQLGKRYEGTPDELMSVISKQHPDLKAKIKKLPPDTRYMAEYILHSFILGKQCYEAGMSLSALMSIDKQEKYKKKLEKTTDTYIW